MADFTRKAICQTFMDLLDEKALKKITVKDIVDNCHINRNTFYYYFKDIPDLIETILEEDSEHVLEDNPNLNNVEDCINTVIEHTLKKRNAFLHIYKSANRAFFEQYHWRVCEYVVNSYLEKRLQGIQISEFDKNVLTTYTKDLIFGTVMDWLENDLKEDIHPYVHRICELKQGDFDLFVEKCKIS